MRKAIPFRKDLNTSGCSTNYKTFLEYFLLCFFCSKARKAGVLGWLLEIFQNLLFGCKCLCSSFRNDFPIIVFTGFLLVGLNLLIFLFTFFCFGFFIFLCLKELRNSILRDYSCVVIALFNLALCRSAYSTVSFGKLVFCLFCAFCVFCFESNVLS